MFELMPFERRHQNFMDYMDALDKSFFGDNFEKSVAAFKTDIRDEGDHYLMEAELPGFQKEEIKISVEEDCLTIRAAHSGQNEEKRDGYLRRERSYGSFQRSFDINGIDPEGIKAAYNNGVLELTLPKHVEAAPPKKEIQIL